MRISGLVVFAVAAFGAALLGAGAAQASTVKVWCPTEARGTVTHNGDASFWATPQSSSLQRLSIERIGGNVALSCHYQMFGGDYIIWRQPPADHPNCVVSPPEEPGRKFYCQG